MAAKVYRVIEKIESLCNRIPHPFWIFTALALLVFCLSAVLDGRPVDYPDYGGDAHRRVESLVTAKYLLGTIYNLDKLFLQFKPLPIVLLLFMGTSMLQGSGALSALIRCAMARIPVKTLLFFAAFIGVNGNIASDVGVIVIPTLYAAIFQSLNMNAWVGIILGYACVNGGYTLNMFIAGTDVILAQITNSVLSQSDAYPPVSPFCNWYFMFVGSLVVIALTVYVTERFVKKKYPYILPAPGEGVVRHEWGNRLSGREKRGLYAMLAGSILFVASAGLLLHGQEVRLANINVTGFLFVYFVMSGLLFGVFSGTIVSLRAIPEILSHGVVGAKFFIVTALPASIFIAALGDSNIGGWIGVTVIDAISRLRIPPLALLVIFIAVIATFNLLISSGSIKWMLIAPIALPIFSQLSIPPEMVQLAYRIGDTCTNCISPGDYYLPVIIGLMEIYKAEGAGEVGIGTVIVSMLPYSVAYLVGLTTLFVVWYSMALPLGF